MLFDSTTIWIFSLIKGLISAWFSKSFFKIWIEVKLPLNEIETWTTLLSAFLAKSFIFSKRTIFLESSKFIRGFFFVYIINYYTCNLWIWIWFIINIINGFKTCELILMEVFSILESNDKEITTTGLVVLVVFFFEIRCIDYSRRI